MTPDEILEAMRRFPPSSVKLIIIDDATEKFYTLLGLYWDVDLKPWSSVPFEVKTWLREAMQENFEGADVILPRCLQPKTGGSPLMQWAAKTARAAFQVVPKPLTEAEVSIVSRRTCNRMAGDE